MRYSSHDPFVDPAREKPELWRTTAGVLITLVAGLSLYQMLLSFLTGLAGPTGGQAVIDALTFGSTPLSTLYNLASFGLFGIGAALAVRTLHRRSPLTLIGPLPVAIADFLRVAAAVAVLYLVLQLFLPETFETERNRAMSTGLWIILLPLSLGAIFIQAGTEELFFRGYLQQQIAARFPGTPLWAILPAALFGLAHFSPATSGENAELFGLWAICFGLAAADLTARTGSIGAAVGFHLANNAFALLVTALPGPGSGLALYLLPIRSDDPALMQVALPELATLICAWLAARVALRV